MGNIARKRGLVAILAGLLLMTACSSGNDQESAAPAASPSASPTASATASGANADGEGAANGNNDPLGKYADTVALSTFRCTNDSMSFPAGDSIDNNVWYRAYEEQLGIKVTNKWRVSDTQCEEKTNLSIVSGDLPDFFPVNAKQLKTLADSGMLEDMTDVVEQYASPLVKDFLTVNGGLAQKAATMDGRLMALPGTTRGLNGVDMIWIREDWKQKLGLPDPQTMDDVLAIIKAFVEQDPDGNGKKDTFGLNMHKNFYDGYSGLAGFFTSYHAYPFTSSSTSMWIEGADGSLVYGGIQPEMKPALLALQKLYKEGAIDPQFVVYDGAKSAENEKQGKTGLHFGYSWNIGWPLDANDKKNNPEMEWKPYPIASIDDQPAMVQVTDPSSYWHFAVKKGTKHPEAVVKMMNLFFENIFSDNADPNLYHTTLIDDVGYPLFQYAAVQGEHPEKNQTAFYKVNEAIKSGDTSGLNPEQKRYYEDYMAYRGGDLNYWGADRTWGPEGSFSVLGYYKENNLLKVNAFNGAPTDTMAQKGSILRDMEIKMMTEIILGKPIELFDEFVANWKQSGGDQITKEVNDWYTSNR